MPFFVERGRLELEYLGDTTKDNSDKDTGADSYADAELFAFFFVRFGCTRKEYDGLTPTERAFIIKAYENKTVDENNLVRDAVYNALLNIELQKHKRGKKKLIPLFKKKPKPANREEMRSKIADVEKHEQEAGKEWVKLIYEANGRKMPAQKKTKGGK